MRKAALVKLSRTYRREIQAFLALCFITLACGALCFHQAILTPNFLPQTKSEFEWIALTNSDKDIGGRSSSHIQESTYSIDYAFHITNDSNTPYANLNIAFINTRDDTPHFVDLSNYSKLTLAVSCTPKNTLSLSLNTLDSRKGDGEISFRTPMAYFSCDENWKEIAIDLTKLEIPEWWLYANNLPLSDRHYDLSKVSNIIFGSSTQSPKNTDSQLKIGAFSAEGIHWEFIYGYIAVFTMFWLAFFYWVLRCYIKSLAAKISDTKSQVVTTIPYQQLSVDSQKSKEKSALLHFMSTEYANPDLSVDMAIKLLGMNRSKINQILKKEMGLTFTAYQNKLRLTEAARLISERSKANVAEVAYSVGFNNVSYFNKLFKQEFGCTPKAYQSNHAEFSSVVEAS